MEKTGKERFYEIDLLRFIAALSVMTYHYTTRGWAADNLSILSFADLSPIFKYGYLGVDLFFMISGFVILMTALNRNASGFVISRINRLYPTYWICVSLTALVTVLIGGARYSVSIGQYLANLSMLHQLAGIDSVDGVYWTLLIELKFYFIIFILLAVDAIDKIKIVLGAWLILILLVPFMDTRLVRFVIFPQWGYYFIAGATFYLIRLEGLSLYKAALIAASFFLSLKWSHVRAAEFQEHYHIELSASVITFVMVAFYTIFFLISTRRSAFLNKKVFLQLGAMTYPLYLIHQNIGFMLFNRLGTSINKYALLVAAIALMLFTAYLINLFIEKRLNAPFKNGLRSAQAVMFSWIKNKQEDA